MGPKKKGGDGGGKGGRGKASKLAKMNEQERTRYTTSKTTFNNDQPRSVKEMDLWLETLERK